MKSLIVEKSILIKGFIKKYSIPIIKIFVGIGLLAYLIKKISIHQIIASLSSVNLFYFSFAVILSVLNIYLQFVRWKILVKNESPSIDKNSILKSLLIGFSGGTFTPARSGEYFLRKLTLSELNLSSVITLTFIDKMMLLLNVIFWGALVSFGMMLFFYKVDHYVTASLFILFATFFSALFMMIYSKRFYNYLKELKNRFNFKLPFVKKLIEPLSDLNNQLISKLILIAFINYLIIVLQFSIIVVSFNVSSSFELLMVAAVMVYFTKTLIPSITLGEIGIREGAAIYFFGLFGCNEAIAFNSSMLLFILNLLLPSIIGLYFLLRLKRA
jgi:uncharacterized protein (TIRG00374 family)